MEITNLKSSIKDAFLRILDGDDKTVSGNLTIDGSLYTDELVVGDKNWMDIERSTVTSETLADMIDLGSIPLELLHTAPHKLAMQMGASATNINLFNGVNSVSHSTDKYVVYINKERTTQSFNSLTFNAGDLVEIVTENESGFPRLYMNNKNYATTISALPYMTDASGVWKITSMTQAFNNCKLLTTIGDGFFNNMSSVTNFSGTFQNCTSLLEIPKNLFKYTTNVDDFSYLFYYCTSLKSIPKGLFDYTPKVTNMRNAFYRCSEVKEIPSGLFDSLETVYSFDSTFSSCNALETIPSGLFDNNPKVTTFYWTFSGTDIKTVPSGLFDNNVDASDFTGIFNSCGSLVEIPSGLFSKNVKATTFNNAFAGCKSLKRIPSGLFDNNTKVTDLAAVFSNCSDLESVPSGLFDKITLNKSFGSVFASCGKLKSIPSGLFDKNTEVTSFGYAFYNCDGLTSIPSGIFSKNAKVTNFEYAFNNCEGLLSVPKDIFAYNTEVTNMNSVFNSCYGLTNTTLKIGSSKVSSASYFASYAGKFTIYVPRGTTTETTFTNMASSNSNVTLKSYASGLVTVGGNSLTYTDILDKSITLPSGATTECELYVGCVLNGNITSVSGTGVTIENNVVTAIEPNFIININVA